MLRMVWLLYKLRISQLVYVFGRLFTVSVVSPDQLHVNAVANTAKSGDELRYSRYEIEGPLSKSVH